MAIVRCKKCGLDTTRTKHSYHPDTVLPVGYPDTAVICGKSGCKNPGEVYLEDMEYAEYQKGQRFFQVKTYTIKVKVI